MLFTFEKLLCRLSTPLELQALIQSVAVRALLPAKPEVDSA
jgi:hypothetical protein